MFFKAKQKVSHFVVVIAGQSLCQSLSCIEFGQVVSEEMFCKQLLTNKQMETNQNSSLSALLCSDELKMLKII